MIVNKTVSKGYLNPIETGGLPYDVMVWGKADGSCWGYGMPYLTRSKAQMHHVVAHGMSRPHRGVQLRPAAASAAPPPPARSAGIIGTR